MNTQSLRAYHGDPAIKAKYIARIRHHRAAEHLTQGIGWENDNPNKIRGCAVGCTLESYEHDRYPTELGLPEWLAHLVDRIFERLPPSEAQTFPEEFLEAIAPGANVEPVRHQLAILRMDRLIEMHKAWPEVVDAIRQVRACHAAALIGDPCDWWAAGSAAAEAARSAESAVRSAAESAAESASETVRSAGSSATWSTRSEAESAAETVWSAARSAAWRQEASDLLGLLRAVAA